jgi:plasmid stability protein
MPILRIKNLDPQIYEKLSLQAATRGISIEEEVRRILFQAVTNPEKMSDVFEKYFGLENGIDLDLLKQQQKPHNPIKFDT